MHYVANYLMMMNRLPNTFSNLSHHQSRAWLQTFSRAIQVLLLLCLLLPFACRQAAPQHPYEDLTHFSKTFGREKYFRLYLPQAYHNGESKYPVIYFFHGWGGRYKSDDNAKLAYDSLQKLVDRYKAILVMWDGNVDEQEPRPYNIGSH